MSQFCGKCGAKRAENFSACPDCGAAYPEGALPEEITEVSPELPEQTEPPALPEPEFNSEPQEQQPSGNRVLLTILSVAAALVLFAAVTLAQATLVAREMVNPQNVQALVREVVDEIDIADIPVGGVINNTSVDVPDFERRQIGDNTILSEVIFNSLHEYYLETYDIDEAEVRLLLNNSQLNRFIGDIAEDGVEYIMTGDNERDAIVGSERIVGLVRSNADEIENITGFPFESNPEYEQILRETLARTGIDDMTWGDIDNSAPEIRTVQRAFRLLDEFSMLVLVASIVLAVLLAAAIVAVNRRKITNSLLYIGIPCVISGTMMMLTSFFVNAALTGAISGAGIALNRGVESAVEQAFANVTSLIFLSGLVVFAAGLVMVVVKIAVAAIGRQAG
jgi:hypothetical protein